MGVNIKIFQILNIPDNNLNNTPNNISNNPLQYTVQSGDTLSKIAQNHKTTSKEILKINNINNPNLIKIGQVLNIPKQNKYTPSVRNFKQIKQIEEDINKGSDLDIINTYPNYKQELLKTRSGVKKRINFYRQQQGLNPLAYIPTPDMKEINIT